MGIQAGMSSLFFGYLELSESFVFSWIFNGLEIIEYSFCLYNGTIIMDLSKHDFVQEAQICNLIMQVHGKFLERS